MVIRARGLALVGLLLALVAACDAVGLTTPSSSPTMESPDGTVRLALAAVSDHDYAGLQALTCSLNKDNAMMPFLGSSGLLNLNLMGIREREVAGAMAITYSDVSIKEIRRDETEAYLTLAATGTPTIDQGKMRVIVTKVLKAQHSKATKAEVDAAMTRLDLTPTKFSTGLQLAKKGKSWLIC